MNWPKVLPPLLVAMALGASACGASGAPGAGTAPAAGRVSGPVEVLYAGSLVNAMEHEIGPAFDAASGASFQGFAGGSTALANEIKGGVRVADVFVSAAAAADHALQGKPNGDWVSWYATFARSPLVLAYSPKSRFARDFRTMPWYRVLTLPGIRVGRTDPTLDPKGKLTVQALDEAARAYHLPHLPAEVRAASTVLPEETMAGRLQAGQLDAGFFYTLEAAPLHLATVGLGAAVPAAATFTVTVVNRAPHPAAAAAFVAFLLAPKARSILTGDGMTPLPPKVSGSPAALPRPLAGLARG